VLAGGVHAKLKDERGLLEAEADVLEGQVYYHALNHFSCHHESDLLQNCALILNDGWLGSPNTQDFRLIPSDVLEELKRRFRKEHPEYAELVR
jgi:hypothetical protein